MDIVEYTDKFQQLEIDNNFFELSDAEGLQYWDIVRHDVFYAVYYELANIKTIQIKEQVNLLWSVKSIPRFISKYMQFAAALRRGNYEYISFTCSRFTDNGVATDYLSKDILSFIEDKTLVIETLQQEGRKMNSSVFNMGLSLARYKSNFKKRLKQKKSSYIVTDILNEAFRTNCNINFTIERLITKYKVEYKYYYRLFKQIAPKAVFFVQNGIQKGMVAAATKLNIPTVELQHGLIGYIHPAYSYPKSIEANCIKTLPKFFFCFSNFWVKNLNYPIQHIVSIGNNFYAEKTISSTKQYALTVIFADIYTLDLISFVDELLREGFKEKIALKLHPNQANEVAYIKNYYATFNNVEVIYTEKTMQQVLATSESILAIQSTAVYEALHYNLKVFIYTIKDYRTHLDVFNNINVYLINSTEELLCSLNKEYVDVNEEDIFEKFNTTAFLSFLNNLEQHL